jgi:glycerol-3-phosphate acyltransferase PlsY
MLLWLGALLIGYLLGSVPPGYLICRVFYGVNVREIGSGRTGGTNVMRAAGLPAAIVSGIADILKALLAVLVARWFGGSALLQSLSGVAAVLGHNHSIFLGFKGGAGTAATVGGATGLWPWNAVVLAPTLLAVGLGSRYASLGSLAVVVLLPIIYVLRAALGVGPWEHIVHGLLTSLLTVWALRPNIRRLLKGEERVIDAPKGHPAGSQLAR